MSSKNTKRLKRSPVRQKPLAAASTTRVSTWASGPNVGQERAARSAATVSVPARTTPAAANESTANETPSTTPWWGRQPPNQ